MPSSLISGDQVTLAQTQLRGIARVLTFEHPELKTTLVDVDADGTGHSAALLDELLAGADQDEVALRDGHRYVSRLVAAPTTPFWRARRRESPHDSGSGWPVARRSSSSIKRDGWTD